jgi:hypothetical protein
MLDVIRRIKWGNIAGLILLVLIVLVIISAVSFFTVILYGDCVEKAGTSVCFSMDNNRIAPYQETRVTLDIRNTQEVLSDAEVTMGLSPNLEALGDLTQEVVSMAPGDSVKRDFMVKSKGERGKFVVRFDINKDKQWDKELYITVE